MKSVFGEAERIAGSISGNHLIEVLFCEADEADEAVALSDCSEPAQEYDRIMMMIDSRAAVNFFISSNQARMGNIRLCKCQLPRPEERGLPLRKSREA